MQKENLFFFSFSSESTFDKVKGTNKRRENQILFGLFIFIVYLCTKIIY